MSKEFQKIMIGGVLGTSLVLSAFSQTLSVSASDSSDVLSTESDSEASDDSYRTSKTILLVQSGAAADTGSSLCVDMTYDDRWLTTDCKAVYNYELAEFAVALSTNIYDGVSCLADGKTISTDKTVLLSSFGFEDVTQYTLNGSDYEFDPNDTTSIVIGHKPVTVEDQAHDVFVIVVRGTNGTPEEWASNFDVGNSDVSYTDRTGQHPQWTDPDNHKGFDVAANRVKDIVNDYVSDINEDAETEQDFLFTGHSRGAGIANILGAEFEAEGYDSCAYTFASPNTTTAPGKYDTKCVFNIVNENDFITTLPLSAWGFARYGRDISADISENETIREAVNKLLDSEYSGADPSQMDAVFTQLADSRDMLYSDDSYSVCFDSLAEKDAALAVAQAAADELGIGQYVSFEDASQTDDNGKYYYNEALCTGAYMYGLSLLMSGTSDFTGLIGNLAMLNTVFPAGSPYSTGMTDLLSVFTTDLEGTVYPHMPVCYYAITDGLKGETDYGHEIDMKSGICKVCGKKAADAAELIQESQASEDTQDPEATQTDPSQGKGFRPLLVIIPVAVLILAGGTATLVLLRKKKG